MSRWNWRSAALTTWPSEPVAAGMAIFQNRQRTCCIMPVAFGTPKATGLRNRSSIGTRLSIYVAQTSVCATNGQMAISAATGSLGLVRYPVWTLYRRSPRSITRAHPSIAAAVPPHITSHSADLSSPWLCIPIHIIDRTKPQNAIDMAAIAISAVPVSFPCGRFIRRAPHCPASRLMFVLPAFGVDRQRCEHHDEADQHPGLA